MNEYEKEEWSFFRTAVLSTWTLRILIAGSLIAVSFAINDLQNIILRLSVIFLSVSCLTTYLASIVIAHIQALKVKEKKIPDYLKEAFTEKEYDDFMNNNLNRMYFFFERILAGNLFIAGVVLFVYYMITS